ncbi:MULTISPECIES: CoA ester lyase [unclassified Minwuia]|jgi:citrate lyase subunit beta / citryl-CoA lyase|uniref:HpcH/HpaI aldolase/citrate lyase family protein n=1 Tax=unclassified Minwuia TaxID=2618799 RepID=UPI0024791D10|nr:MULTISPECIES: CoA ester lyase [unclassified Minwuia]
MAASVRPRRSVLYMPGSNTRAMEKAKTIAADAIILDLEDAVSPDAKATARQQIVDALAAGGYGKREMIVRINGLDTPWGADDMAAIAKSGADAILVPKINDAETVQGLVAAMDKAGAPASMALWCMMETPIGILNAQSIGAASDRVAVWVMGTNDIAKDTGAHHTPMRLPMVTALGICMLAARAYGIQILDGVYNDIKDEDGFRDICQQGLEMGFDGKTLIHPSQVVPCNEVFSPTEAQLEMAARIVAGFEEAQREGKGVVTVDGRMIENLHVEQAKKQLALAAAVAEMG